MSDTINISSNVSDSASISPNVSNGVTISTSVNTSTSISANVITGGKGDSGSNLTSQGSQTSSFTAVANNYYPVDGTSGAVTVTLPTSVVGQQIAIKKTDSSTNLVNISGTINGSVVSLPLRLQNQGKVLIPDGSGGWNIIAGDLNLPTLDSRYINQSTGLAGYITQGSNVTITGSGTIASPYVVSSTGGSGAVTSVNARTGAVTGLAEDNTVVHLSGTETVTGSKTFSLTPTLSTGATLTAQAPSYTAGKIIFDNTTNSLTFYNSDANVSLQVGQEEWIQVINNTGSTITNGSAVYLSGASGSLPTIALAKADAGNTTIGAGLATESIANGATGFVTCIGNVNGIDTSTFTAGSTVYISATTAGALTSTAPVAPNFRYRIGIVGVSSATVGTIHVTPSTASLGTGASNQLLGVNNAGTAQEYKTISGTQGVSITNGTNTLAVGLGAITPTSVNSVVLSGSATPTLAVTGTTTVSGANTGDQTTITGNSGTATKLQTARTIGTVTGDATSTGSTFDGSANNTNALTFATVNANVGSFTKASITVNAKGLITAASSGTADFITSLTTTGTSGNASVTTGVLNIPNYTYTLTTASTTVLGGVKVDGTTITIASGVISASGSSSPLTTKGDVYTFSTTNARLPVGTDGFALVADSTQTTGLKWASVGGTGNMNTSTYDPAGIAQQLVGTTASQTLTTKTITSGKYNQLNDTNGNNNILLTATASAVNGINIINKVTGGFPVITPGGTGSDTNMSLILSGHGTGGITMSTNDGASLIGTFSPALGTNNNFSFGTNTTGAAPFIGVAGSDTNVSLNLTTKGTGVVQANGVTVVDISTSQSLTNKNLSSGTNTFPTFNQNTTGNAGTATTLQTARLINNVSFNGSVDIDTDSTGVFLRVTQTAHGFSVGNWVRSNTTAGAYTLSQANNSANAVVNGVVQTVVNANSFILRKKGTVTGLTGLTAGSSYFLDPTTAGAITATAPATAGQVVKPLLTADSTTSGDVNIQTGIVVATASGADMILASAQTNTGAKTFNNNTLLLAGSTSGTTTLQANAVAGAGTVVLPTTGTVATLAGSEALTNKSVNGLTVTSTTGTLTIGSGSTLVTAGAFSTTLTATAATNVTLPTSGTLYGTATGSITSSQLATSLSDETGTGAAVFGTSPTIATPSITYTNNSVPAAALATTAISLGYAQITADVTTASTTVVQATGLTATVTIPAGGRKVKITFFARSLNNNTSGAYAQASIWVGTVGTGTKLGGMSNRMSSASQDTVAMCMAVHTPSAGSTTYNIGYNAAGSGTADLSATATEPSFILVEAI